MGVGSHSARKAAEIKMAPPVKAGPCLLFGYRPINHIIFSRKCMTKRFAILSRISCMGAKLIYFVNPCPCVFWVCKSSNFTTCWAKHCDKHSHIYSPIVKERGVAPSTAFCC